MAPNDSSAATTKDPQPVKPARRSRKGAFAAIAILLVILALLPPIINLFTKPPSGTVLVQVAAAGKDADWVQAASLLEANCLDCHSIRAQRPWYGRLPVAASLIERDQVEGARYMDMLEALVPPEGQPVSEAALAELEFVLERGTMPPTRYRLLHWNRGIDAAGKETILKWLRGVRKRHYATAGAAEAFATDVLQPLPTTMPADARKVALGNKLYHDVRLSGDNTLSCASCHELGRGGTDQLKSSIGINRAVGPINSPTTFNAVFCARQFWDGRAADLQEQAAGPVENPIEMGAKFPEVVAKLSADAPLLAEFKAIYPEGITKESITNAIAEFERTLVTPNSRFDQYLAGKADALNADELHGLRLFRENGCVTCHVGKAMGGQSFERMGRRADYFAARGNLTEADNGRFNATGEECDRHAFKVPTLRNVAVTFPYFHDGSQATLDGAVKIMSQYQAYRTFADPEVAKVVAFLKTLTGEYNGKPLQ